MLKPAVKQILRRRLRKLGAVRTALYSLFRVRTLGASIIAVDDSGDIVLLKNSYGPSTWQLPGGGVKRNENFEVAARREMSEEAGIDLKADGQLTLRSLHHQQVDNWSNYVAIFEARGWTQRDVDPWEISNIGRFDPNALPEGTSPGHRRRVEEWLGLRPTSPNW